MEDLAVSLETAKQVVICGGQGKCSSSTSLPCLQVGLVERTCHCFHHLQVSLYWKNRELVGFVLEVILLS